MYVEKMPKGRPRKGFKLVLSISGKLYGAATLGPALVEYDVGRITVPNEGCGPLCVWKDERYARSTWLRGKLYECVYTASSEDVVYGMGTTSLHMLNLMCPGVVLASHVKLVRRIW